MSRPSKAVEAVLIGLAIGIAVAALGASGVVAMAIYTAYVDDQTTPEHLCECCA